MRPVELCEFSNREELVRALADSLVADLAGAIEQHGSARFAVSGGNTPRALFGELANRELDWAKVHVTLVDERCVGDDDGRSNARMVRSTLLTDKAASAQFAPLWCARTHGIKSEPGPASASASARKFDVVILGMGTDGHTASWFPGAENLDILTSAETSEALMLTSAPGAGEPRVTFTLPPIASAQKIYLHIEGDEKRTVYEDAMDEGAACDMPVRHILRHPDAKITTYWAP